MSIGYITDSTKCYPAWIKEHEVFKHLDKIDKIFPKIGLHNFKEECNIVNTASARAAATNLISWISRSLQAGANTLNNSFVRALAEPNSQARNEKCAKMQSLLALHFYFNRFHLETDPITYAYKSIDTLNDKVVLKQHIDIFSDGKPNPLFKKNENLLKIYGKFVDLFQEFEIKVGKLEDSTEYKEFSRINVPSKDCVIVFSSSGEEGAWDIGTISMRGITSCQSWNAPQSRGLIGSISSKYVGVIYLQSNVDVPGYGKKMNSRCIVRFAINSTTRKPALILDVMYPAMNDDALRAFRETLHKKTGLEVYCVGDKGKNVIPSSYYIPEDDSSKWLKQGETQYMDTKITPLKFDGKSIKQLKAHSCANKTTIKFIDKTIFDITKQIKIKREEYLKAEEQIDKQIKDQGAEQKSPPKMDKELHKFGSGGAMNLFVHFDKRFGKDSIGKLFTQAIFDAIKLPDPQGLSEKEYHRKFVISFIGNKAAIKKIAWEKTSSGSWMTSFPKSSEKIFNMIFSQISRYMILSLKDDETLS